jgi:hypothetical protein
MKEGGFKQNPKEQARLESLEKSDHSRGSEGSKGRMPRDAQELATMCGRSRELA